MNPRNRTSVPLLRSARIPRLRTCTGLLAALALIPLSAPPAHAIAPVRFPDAPQSSPAGFGTLDPAQPKGLPVDQIIQKFGERETAFAKARDQYTFRQTVKIDTISDTTGKPDGTYQQVTDIVFSDGGARTEHVVFAPANTIEKLIMTQSDFDDIEHRLPFVLTAAQLPQYDITYLGQQHVDDLETYVFDVKPKTLEKGKRYFQGKVWVDQQELQIVLINGKSVPDILKSGHEDLSPPYTTYYQEVDGGNWFPVYTKADGVLHFPAQTGAIAQDVRIRYVVRYENYKRFRAKSRIIYNGEDLPPADKNAPTAPPPPPAADPKAPLPQEQPQALPPSDPDAPSIARPKKPQP